MFSANRDHMHESNRTEIYSWFLIMHAPDSIAAFSL